MIYSGCVLDEVDFGQMSVDGSDAKMLQSNLWVSAWSEGTQRVPCLHGPIPS